MADTNRQATDLKKAMGMDLTFDFPNFFRMEMSLWDILRL